MIGGAIEQSASQIGPELGATILIKATVVLAAAGLTTLGLKRASASVRYAVWSTAAVMLILLPVMALLMPTSWPGKIVPSMVRPGPSLESLVPSRAAAPSTVPSTGRGPEQASHAGVSRAFPLSSAAIVEILMGIWLMGSVIMLVRLGIHLLRVNAITRRGSPVVEPEIAQIAARAIEMAGIWRPVRVITSDESSMPFSWGLWHPAIVLPPGAAGWTIEQKRSVLNHEVAHIARWDYPIHLTLEIVKALYWPNPLVWIASRRCAMERERACDDFALRGGSASSLYASHLIAIARAQVRAAPASATTMAGEPGLFERVRHVMDEGLSREPIRRAMLVVFVCLAFAVTLPLGTMKVLSADTWEIPTTEEVMGDLSADEDPLVRRRAAWWLGEHEDRMAVIPLIEALRDDDARVRLAAAWALGEIKDRDSIRALVRTLENDDDQLVREMAALALGEIEDRKAVRPLMDAFDREETLRTAVIWALGEIRGEEAEVARRVAFGKWGREPYDNRQVWVGDYADYDLDDLSLSPEVLMARLRSGNTDERISAAGSFGILGIIDGIDDVDPAVDALLDALRDEVPEVRALAVWSLDEINPSRSIRGSGAKAVGLSLTEYRMNALGYLYLQVNKPDQAIEIFKANVELHPDSWNCYDSLGEAYMMAGDVDRAIANYERSLDLNPHNENGREKLRALKRLW